MSDYSSVYHQEGCSKIKKSYYKVPLKKVLSLNSKPCEICKPPTSVLNSESVIKPNDNSNFEFSKVIYADSVGKEKLFAAIHDCFATNYGSSKEVIQMIDKDEGVIVGKGAMLYNYGALQYICYEGFVNYTIRVAVKDNRYKVDIFNINHQANNTNAGLNGVTCSLGEITQSELSSYSGMGKKYYNNVWVDVKEKISAHAEYIFSTLERCTRNLKSKIDKEDW